VAVVMLIASIGVIRRALRSPVPTVNEAPAVYSDVPMTANELKGESS
jgi:carbon starvation protein